MGFTDELQKRTLPELLTIHKHLKKELRDWEKGWSKEHDDHEPELADKKEAGVFHKYTQYALVRKLIAKCKKNEITQKAMAARVNVKPDKGKERDEIALPDDFHEPLPEITVTTDAWGEASQASPPTGHDGAASSGLKTDDESPRSRTLSNASDASSSSTVSFQEPQATDPPVSRPPPPVPRIDPTAHGDTMNSVLDIDVEPDARMNQESVEAIQVCARFRPANDIELGKEGTHNIGYISDETVEVSVKDMPRVGSTADYSFKFNKVFPDYAEQEDVYEELGRPMVDNLINGYHASILAYGQTGSGKTHTMFGADLANDRDAGLIPRLLCDLFDRIKGLRQTHVCEVQASFIEIYNESLRDLFHPKQVMLQVRETADKNLWIPSARQIPVQDARPLLRLIKKGGMRRVVASTQANEHSSRSHAIVILTLKQTHINGGLTKCAQMYLADLAGSERVQKTNVDGKELHEAKYINRSLLSLGQVIERLSKKASIGVSHIPYRDSLLTRLLMNSFGGNARTALIVTCSSHSYNDRETLSTLRFGARASKIVNLPKMNNAMGVEELKRLLTLAKAEIKGLRRTIYTLRHSLDRPSEIGRASTARFSVRGTSSSLATRDENGILERENAKLKKMYETVTEQNKRYRDQIQRWVDQANEEDQDNTIWRCPITREIMSDPVVAQDGFTYDRYAISEWFNANNKSPMTGKSLVSKELVPNRFIRSYIQNHPLMVQEAEEVKARVQKKEPAQIRQDVMLSGLVLMQSSNSR